MLSNHQTPIRKVFHPKRRPSSSVRKTVNSQDKAKKKIAPRSGLQFKIGPQFGETVSNLSVINSKGEVVKPAICPRIDRGFERIDNEWIGYKRNYFTLVSTFFFHDISFNEFAREKYNVINPKTGMNTRIKYFGLRLISKCADDESFISLVQHTAKRDRGPQVQPPIHPAIPSELPTHEIIRQAANVRNMNKIDKLSKVFFFDKEQYEDDDCDISGLKLYPTNKIIKVARYERIQFSSSINYKKPSSKKKRFKLLVELVGFVDRDDYLTLAYTETPPLIVRGRSPSNYNEQSSNGFQSGSSFQTSTPMINKTTTIEADTTVTTNPMLLSKSENCNSTNLFECQLDDFETFKILSKANRELSELTNSHLNTPLTGSFCEKKKRGRKPKVKKLIESKEKVFRVEKPKKTPDSKIHGVSNLIKTTQKNSGVTINNVQNNDMLNKNYDLKLIPTDLPEMDPVHEDDNASTPEPDEFQMLESCDFDSSVICFKFHPDLSSSKAQAKYPSFFSSKEATEFTNDENYDNELLGMKNEPDLLHKHETEILESLSGYQSNPSEVLLNDYLDDGPSFIVY